MPEIPEEIKYLIPKSEPIVVGSDVKELHPLSLSKWDSILAKLEEVSGKLFTPDFIKSLDDANVAVGVMIERLIEVMRENIGPVLAIALDNEEEEIKEAITIPQITYAVKKIWDMNLKQPMVDINSIIGSLTPKVPLPTESDLTDDDIEDVLGNEQQVIEEPKDE